MSTGSRDSSIIIASKKKGEPTLKEGDSCLYADKSMVMVSSDKVQIKAGEQDLGALISKLINILIDCKTTDLKTLDPKSLENLSLLEKDWEEAFCVPQPK